MGPIKQIYLSPWHWVKVTDQEGDDTYQKFRPMSDIRLSMIGPAKQIFVKHKIAIIFLSISLNMCYVHSKEPSHWDGSFEFPQHMFWLRNKKIFFRYALLSGGLGMS